ncbi:transposase family protein [Virgibacillus oceani]
MLNLPKLNILDVTESEDDYRLLVETISSLPSYCPKCGTVANLYKHGKKKQLFFYLPMHAQRVGIYIKRQRYKCRACNETFFETLSDMDVNRSVKRKFKEVDVTFGKMLPDQLPNWTQSGYEWVYEEIYGADFSTLTKAMEEGSF